VPICLMGLLTLVSMPQVARADDAITVVSSDASLQFPNTVTFTLVAASQQPITMVNLIVDTPGKDYGDVPVNVRPSFTPGTAIRASWVWNSPGPGYELPPGVEIDYRWSIQGSDGASLQTTPAILRYADTRFKWQERSEPGVHLYWNQAGAEFGSELMQTAQASLKQLRDEQGVDLLSDVSVYVYSDQGELRGAMLGSPSWIGGRAYPEFGTILLVIDEDHLPEGERSLVHELTHQLVYQQTVDPLLGSHVPLWLNEGLAVTSEGPTSSEFKTALSAAVRENGVSSFRNLDGAFPYDAQASTLAYAQSESFVRFLLAKNGSAGMRSLLAALRHGNRIDSAITQSYGADLDVLQNQWRASIGAKQLGESNQTTAEAPDPAKRVETLPAPGAMIAGLSAVCVLIASTIALLVRRMQGRPNELPPA
jgi:Peptidase MA superfamily